VYTGVLVSCEISCMPPPPRIFNLNAVDESYAAKITTPLTPVSIRQHTSAIVNNRQDESHAAKITTPLTPVIGNRALTDRALIQPNSLNRDLTESYAAKITTPLAQLTVLESECLNTHTHTHVFVWECVCVRESVSVCVCVCVCV
jgi:hypothetical protein